MYFRIAAKVLQDDDDGSSYARVIEDYQAPKLIGSLRELGKSPRIINNKVTKKDSFYLTAFFYGATFILACFSAAVYWYSAEKAGDRYEKVAPQLEIFFQGVAPTSSLVTNVMFNWMSFLDLWGNEVGLVSAVWSFCLHFSDNWLKKLVAIVASAATIAPFFFVGFEGSPLQKALVGVSGALSLPVFYQGSLNFYDYFNAPFIQRIQWYSLSILWYLCCSPEKKQLAIKNYHLATDKFILVNYLKEINHFFYYASAEERDQFIDGFLKQDTIEFKSSYLLLNNIFSQRLTGFQNTPSAHLRFWLCSGMGLIGFAVIGQNTGHVIGTWQGVFDLLKEYSLVSAYIAAAMLTTANLIPGLGFSFSGMANFDLIDLCRKMTFWDVPQIQRVLMGPAPTRENFLLPVLSRLALYGVPLILRVLYICSGFSNDEVNYEGAMTLHFGYQGSMTFGFWMGFLGALVFNGGPCENLLRVLLEKRVQSVGDPNAIKQVKFEIGIRALTEAIEISEIEEFSETVTYVGAADTFASFYRKAHSKDSSDFIESDESLTVRLLNKSNNV